ncbi:PQQ-binding-like beta-propeller repeat protein [bacterium]|nr:PQQ-binding-like beta-propeller repeat protein [bacterium]
MFRGFIVIYSLIFITLLSPITFASDFNIDKRLLPNINFPWLLIKHDKENSMSSDTDIPRIPEVIYQKDVSANLDVDLATPLIYKDKIILADHEGIYVLNEETGELIWGAELFFDDLHNRKVKDPQPLTRWKPYGLWEFVQGYGIGKNLYVATTNGNNGSLLAFNIKDGNLLWRAKIPSSLTSNIIIGQGKVFLGTAHTDGKVYCYSEEGKLLWSTYIGGNIRGLTIGGSLIFVSSESLKRLYALNINDGKIRWIYEAENVVTSPVYRRGLVIFGDISGNLIVLSEEGKLLWKKPIGVQSSVDGYTYIAISKHSIYVCSFLDGKNYLVSLNLSGNELARVEFPKEQSLGFPIATRNIIIVPTKSKDSSKIYLFWKGTSKIYEIEIKSTNVWLLKVSVAYGNLYIVSQDKDGKYKLLKLGDKEKPVITSITTSEKDNYLEVKIEAYDRQSGLYKAILSYQIDNSGTVYTEMYIGRRYVIEPIGGYGLTKEIYIGRIPYKKDTSIRYAIVVIDNVGNYLISSDYNVI